MKKILSKLLIKFICQPLLRFKDEYEMGEQLFSHLFYDRTNDRAQMSSTMELGKSMTIVGNPGEGKTCLMHYMFINTKYHKNFYPIILDYRYCAPRKKETLIINFVKGMKEYFREIGLPLHQIAQETTTKNYENHYTIIQNNMKNLKSDKIYKTKRPIIFLDDLDYYEHDYISLLRQYFLPFALNRKTVLILSGRKPLIHSLSEDNELRHAFNLRPRKLFLVRVDLKTLFEFKLSCLYDEKERTLFRLLNAFKQPKNISKILRREALIYLKKEGNFDDNPSEDILNLVFGFNDLFWTHLGDVTGRNLRQIEESLPDMFYFQLENENNEINFNSDFASSYILTNYKEPNYLLDLVSLKTNNKIKKLRGNSILQIVLEYFNSQSMVDDQFFDTMSTFGIENKQANEALKKISDAPYSLIDPDFIYNDDTIFKDYKINRKGKFYLDYILNNELYYVKLTERMKYNFPNFNSEVTKSNRRLLKG